eukprot:2612164-Rhodomonas_salina.1
MGGCSSWLQSRYLQESCTYIIELPAAMHTAFLHNGLIGILNKSGPVSFLWLRGHVTFSRYTKQRYSMVPGLGVPGTSNQ